MLKLTSLGKNKTALERINRIITNHEISTNPLHLARYLVLKGHVLISMKQFSEAFSVIQETLDVLKDANLITSENDFSIFSDSQISNPDLLAIRIEIACERARALEGMARLDEALNELQFINSKLLEALPTNKEGLRLFMQFLSTKGSILRKLGRPDEALKELKKGLDVIRSREDDVDDLALGELHNTMGNVLLAKGRLDEALQFFQSSLKLFQEVGTLTRIARELNNIGVIHAIKGEFNEALEQFEKSLEQYQQIGSQQDVAMALNNIGNIHFDQGNYHLALEYYTKSLEIYRVCGNNQDVSHCYQNIGNVHRARGEVTIALQYFEKSLELRETIGNPLDVAAVCWTIGNALRSAGEYQQALKMLERSLKLRQTANNPVTLSESLFSLILVHLDGNWNLSILEKYLQELEQCHLSDPKNLLMSQRYRTCKALILLGKAQREVRRLPQLQDRIKAEVLLEELISEPVIDHEVTITAQLALCRHLLQELRRAPHPDIPMRMTTLLQDLLTISKKQGSYLLVTELYWLQAKFSLLQGNIIQARRLMTQAMLTAEEKGFNHLKEQISQEYNELIQILDERETDAHLTMDNILKLAQLNDASTLEEFVSHLLRGSVPIIEDLYQDIPILFLILGSNGTLLFSIEFSEDISVNPYLISNFLSAIQTFSQEVFSQVINRMKIGEYTVILMPYRTLLFVYAYKGSSYASLKKMKLFLEQISVNEGILNSLEQSSLFARPFNSTIQQILTKMVENIISNKKTIPARNLNQ